MDVFYAAPPITRTITAAIVITSVLVHGGVLSIWWFYFDYQRTFLTLPPEIWRPITSFFVSGRGLGIIFDPYFFYSSGQILETAFPRLSKKGDFAWYMIFNSIIILILSFFVGGFIFLNPLLLAFAYTVSQDEPRRMVQFIVVPVESRFHPYLMLVLTFVMAGPVQALQQATGLISAHAFDFLTKIWPTYGGGSNLLETPFMVRRLFGDDGQRAASTRSYGTAFAGPGSNASTAAPAGASTPSSWTSGSSWGGRGSGRRLGD